MTSSPSSSQNKKPFYKSMSFQVLLTVGLAIVLGYVDPPLGTAMKPLGDAFIRLITMIITLIIFCTV
jgi:aerobic C4-dicarboxylate transport protein